MEQPYPILEYDPSPEAIYSPQHHIVRSADVPAHCVLCFFHDVIAASPTEHPRDGWLRLTRMEDLRPGDVIAEVDGKSTTLHFLRQQTDKPVERPDFCLADFIAPQDSGKADWIGASSTGT